MFAQVFARGKRCVSSNCKHGIGINPRGGIVVAPVAKERTSCRENMNVDTESSSRGSLISKPFGESDRDIYITSIYHRTSYYDRVFCCVFYKKTKLYLEKMFLLQLFLACKTFCEVPATFWLKVSQNITALSSLSLLFDPSSEN